MKRILLLFTMLASISVVTSQAALIDGNQDNGGTVIDLRVNNEGQQTPPQSLGQSLSAIYYSESDAVIVNCQGFGNAIVSILSPTLQVIDSEIIDPSISTTVCLDAPTEPGRYILFITTSYFTAYGFFAVE